MIKTISYLTLLLACLITLEPATSAQDVGPGSRNPFHKNIDSTGAIIPTNDEGWSLNSEVLGDGHSMNVIGTDNGLITCFEYNLLTWAWDAEEGKFKAGKNIVEGTMCVTQNPDGSYDFEISNGVGGPPSDTGTINAN